LVAGTFNVFEPIRSNGNNLGEIILHAGNVIPAGDLDGEDWVKRTYKPTPTIIEAAQALYANHSVEDIARNDAGAKNLTFTLTRIQEIIHRAHLHGRKTICFVTGVPGAGKTLVGLNVATSSPQDEDAVFLSGNGPLVGVLREALARDETLRTKLRITDARQRVRAFVQNIHHFRDEALSTTEPPTERVVIFDEAQRAWDRHHTQKFMIGKRGLEQFDMSEPEFLMSVMDRHKGWSVIVALIGGGQEINSGEIGLEGWRDALSNRFSHWDVYYSDRLKQVDYVGSNVDFSGLSNPLAIEDADLHLATSMRSFRAERLSEFVHYVIEGDAKGAKEVYAALADQYPIRLCRDIEQAKTWVRSARRGLESSGVLASSGAIRLKPHAINVKIALEAPVWFLNTPDDIRSSDFLEDVGTEFEVQGLELDWSLVAWDADYRHDGIKFTHWDFKGMRWSRRNKDESKQYLSNAYRVLLTRARQGMIIFVPEGDALDATRRPEYYEGTYAYLRKCGIPELKKT
jgi:hypothetical protein